MTLPRAFPLILLLVIAALPEAAALPPSPDSAPAARTKAETFFNTIIGGDTAKAFDALLAGSMINTRQPDATSRLKSQLENGLRVYGRPVGFDLLEEKSFGPSLVRYVYIFKLEKYPLIWEFFFYKGTDAWVPIEVRFNDQLAPFKFDHPTVTATDDPTQP